MNLGREVERAEDALIQQDPILGALIKLQRPVVFEVRSNYFDSLCRSIVSQQLSVASAAAIFDRLQSTTSIDPQKISQTADEDFRRIGLSRQKTRYIKDLAGHFVQNPNVYEHLNTLDDESVIEELVKVNGIGVWTAQMFLIFTLSRLDVFAPDDIGIQRAMLNLYHWEQVRPKSELNEIAERWRPYRSVACRHLWKSLHNTPE